VRVFLGATKSEDNDVYLDSKNSDAKYDMLTICRLLCTDGFRHSGESSWETFWCCGSHIAPLLGCRKEIRSLQASTVDLCKGVT